jgi:acyl-CoA synthetase (AMP-forming)/AMP-acid ligase II
MGDDLRPVPDGQPGELCVSGPQTVPGYWRDEARTAERFVTIDVPGAGPAAGWCGAVKVVVTVDAEASIEALYRKLDGLFAFLGEEGWRGTTLRAFAEECPT